MNTTDDQREFLLKLAKTRMPYGRFKGRFLDEIPEPYYVWYRGKGFPAGTLGKYMQAMYELKVNGLEGLVKKIRQTQEVGNNVKKYR